ncbi:ATP-binding protein [Paraclostridium sordellii]|uniref:AAA family ATPase n=1 Tax=Paraclostridium sordellii TaxID=1505 RepID=UPI0005E5CD4E|nr:ATP-binding protein [Paeniclostridium sordellii]CEP80269.1 ATPase [[Clostridium] sordellii] [Paeniclostridium sordellii]
MATGEHVKLLIQSHYDNEDRFRTTALQIAAYEANKGHNALARDIRKIIDSSKVSRNKMINLNNDLNGLIDSKLPDQNMSELVVNREIKQRLNRIVKEYFERDKLKRYGFNNRRKILLTGPPGTGKTMTASVLASKLGLPVSTILMDKMVTKYMGETSSKLRQVFDTISECPGVYLFDEFDDIGSDRSMDNDVGEMRRVLNSFLQLIEQDKSDSIIIAATNNPMLLDQALFRRFDDIIHYNLPNKSEIVKLIKNRLSTFSDKNIEYEEIVKYCKNLSHAEISKVCDDSIKEIILNDIDFVDQKLICKMINERVSSYKLIF